MSAPAVAVSRDGKKLAAAWMDQRAGKGEMNVYWTISDGPALKGDAAAHAETKGLQNHPALVIDEGGTAWIAWEDKRGEKQTIWVRSSVKGDAERELSEPAAEGPAAFPSLAAAAGAVGCVYEAGKRGQEVVVFRRVR